jgi:hypothetical protein
MLVGARSATLSIVLFSLLADQAAAQEVRPDVPEGGCFLNSPDGMERYRRAAAVASESSAAMMANFVTQQTQSYCGVASSIVVLNALGATPAPAMHDYTYWTQSDVFAFLGLPSDFGTAGLSLTEMVTFLQQRLPATAKYAEDSDVATFRADVIAATTVAGNNGTSSCIISNFDRQVVHQAGGGHHSPVGLYDKSTDSVLLLDVARYKYPPSWLPVETLFLAMSGGDPIAEHSRGWAVATAGSVATSAAPELLNTSANTMETMAAIVFLGLLLLGCGIGACGAKCIIKHKQASIDGASPLIAGGTKPMEMVALGSRNDTTL